MKQNDFGKQLDTELSALREDDTFDAPYDPHDQSAVDAFWEDAVLVRGGGPKAVRDALRKKHSLEEPVITQKTKISTTIRLSPEVVAYFKRRGKGWQDSIDEILMKYVLSH
jgi:uncharacterized protein (DUF4415 family)